MSMNTDTFGKTIAAKHLASILSNEAAYILSTVSAYIHSKNHLIRALAKIDDYRMFCFVVRSLRQDIKEYSPPTGMEKYFSYAKNILLANLNEVDRAYRPIKKSDTDRINARKAKLN